MKVLLVQPPVQDFYDTDVRLQPIGLAYLKAAIRKHLPDIDVTIQDYHSGCGRQTVPIPKELRYLAEYYPVADKSPFSTFHQYYHFGKSFDQIESEIAELRPDMVGISCLFTPYYREALEVAARVKKRANAIVVMGGSHASAVPESLLASPHVDQVSDGPVVARSVIEALVDRLRASQQVFDRTGGLHAAGLFGADGTLLVSREDVGRHNAMDKVVGHELLAGRVPASAHIVVVSGRASFELVQKAAVAGTPVFCAVSAPSTLALDAARRLGLTLIGFLREDRFTIYSHPQRIDLS